MRFVRFISLIAFSVAFALAVPVAVPAGPMASARAASAQLPVITTFHPGDFPESLAVDRHGNLYTSLGLIGEVVKVTPGGHQKPLAHLDIGDGLITGLAFDSAGNLYVADATFQASPTPPGIFRISARGAVTRVATLPADSFPNGLAFRDGRLYISDSSLGAIWQLMPGRKAAIWLTPERSSGCHSAPAASPAFPLSSPSRTCCRPRTASHSTSGATCTSR